MSLVNTEKQESVFGQARATALGCSNRQPENVIKSVLLHLQSKSLIGKKISSLLLVELVNMLNHYHCLMGCPYQSILFNLELLAGSHIWNVLPPFSCMEKMFGGLKVRVYSFLMGKIMQIIIKKDQNCFISKTLTCHPLH